MLHRRHHRGYVFTGETDWVVWLLAGAERSRQFSTSRYVRYGSGREADVGAVLSSGASLAERRRVL